MRDQEPCALPEVWGSAQGGGEEVRQLAADVCLHGSERASAESCKRYGAEGGRREAAEHCRCKEYRKEQREQEHSLGSCG